MKKIGIILLNWNGKKDTLECLESLSKLTYPKFFIVVVDNHSSDDSPSAIAKAFPDVLLIQNGDNLGFAGGNNIGITVALEKGADFVFLLNNDTIVDPHILEALLKATEDHSDGGIFGAKILQYHHPDLLDHLGGNWNPKKGDFSYIGGNKPSTFVYDKSLDYVCGCALFCRKEVIEQIGVLDPRFFLLWEESDFCFRAKKANWKSYTVDNALVWHKGSASFSGGRPQMYYFWWRNRLLWIEKNLSPKERRGLYFKVLYSEMFQLYRRYIKKSLLQKLLPLHQTKEKEKELLKYKAGIRGIRDYRQKRFGPLPSDLWKEISTFFSKK
jgi:hypothetical protein